MIQAGVCGRRKNRRLQDVDGVQGLFGKCLAVKNAGIAMHCRRQDSGDH